MVAQPHGDMNSNTPALDELQSKKQWVCWCYETKEGKKTKVPYQAHTGYGASSTNPSHWVSYEEAVKAQSVRRNASGKPYDGIGFVFNKDYTGIDYDHCINEDGSIEPWAQEIINSMPTYCEKSPSETGIHGIVRALLPETPNAKGEMTRQGKRKKLPGNNHPDAAIEMYCQGRFFTMTGNHIPGTPITIEGRQEEVTNLYQKHFGKKEPKKRLQKEQKEPTPLTVLSDYDLIKKARDCELGTEFSALYDYGDIGIYDNDDSRADFNLCRMLGFWFGGDPIRVDRAFRSSALYREKWDDARGGTTYGQMTIENALATVTEYYNPEYKNEPAKRKEEIIIRHIVPQISREEHAKLLHDACLAIRLAIVAHITQNDGTILIIIVPPGVGKSHIAAEIARDEFIIAWMAQNHAMAESIKALQDESIKHIQPISEDSCSHSVEHSIAARKRINTMSIHSKHVDEYGEKELCEYTEQFLWPGTTVFMQQYIKSSWPAQKQAIIIDEINTSDWLPEIEISIRTLQNILHEFSAGSIEDLFIRALQGCITDCAQERTPIDGKFVSDRLNKGNQLINWLGVLGEKYAIPLLFMNNLSLDDPKLEKELENKAPYLLPAIVKAFLFELVRFQSGTLANSRIRIGPNVLDSDYSLFISEPMEFTPFKESEDGQGNLPPIVLLDATASEKWHALLLGKPIKTLRIDVPPAPEWEHWAIRTGKWYGITSLCRYDVTKDLDRAVREIRYILREHVDQDGSLIASQQVGLITFKDCKENMANALGIPLGKTLHFGDLRGKNDLEDCAVLVVVGTPMINPVEIERQVRVLSPNDPTPVTCDPDHWKENRQFSNPQVQDFSEFLINSELTQAAHRNRPIRHEKRIVVSFCMGNIDFLPITHEFKQFPGEIDDNGQNANIVRDDARIGKMKEAYDELSREGKKVTVASIANKAGVRKQTASQFLKEYRQDKNGSVNAIGNNTIASAEPFLKRPNTPTRLCSSESDSAAAHIEGRGVLTPKGIGRVLCCYDMGRLGIRVGVAVDGVTSGMKVFNLQEICEISA